MLTASATFTCDRDGTLSAPMPGWPNSTHVPLPEGWSRFTIDQGTSAGASQSEVGHLCPACAAVFNDFLRAGGGAGMFVQQPQETKP
jgi:hypothetical protein